MTNRSNILFPPPRKFVLMPVLLAGFMLCGFCRAIPAQIPQIYQPVVRPTSTPRGQPIVFKGTGQEKPNPGRERTSNFSMPPRSRQSVNQALFYDVLRANGVLNVVVSATPYAVLTAQKIYVADKAAIDFFNTYHVTSRKNYVHFEDYDAVTAFEVYIQAAKMGQSFMVECSVSAIGGRKFTIKSPGNPDAEKIIGGEANLQVFLLTKHLSWHTVRFEAEPGAPWVLYSCEITATD
jgi:hypothetical protein